MEIQSSSRLRTDRHVHMRLTDVMHFIIPNPQRYDFPHALAIYSELPHLSVLSSATGSPDLWCGFSEAPLCPGLTVTCTCEVSGHASITRWRFEASRSLCPGMSIVLAQTEPCVGEGVPASAGECGPLVMGMNLPTPNGTGSCTLSQLTIVTNHTLHIVCEDLSVTSTVPTAVTLRVVGK